MCWHAIDNTLKRKLRKSFLCEWTHMAAVSNEIIIFFVVFPLKCVLIFLFYAYFPTYVFTVHAQYKHV